MTRRILLAAAGAALSAALIYGLSASGFLPAGWPQPDWPFAERPSLAAISEDPDIRREVVGAVVTLAGSCLAVAAGALMPKSRWPAIVLAALLVWRAAPHLAPLLVPAYPTSFLRSPTGFAAASIVAGTALYPAHCASCHGAEGRGDGPASAGLRVPPADLTAEHLWDHADGELFWWLTHGIDGADGNPVMPGFATVLSPAERWALIDAIRARNAGFAHEAVGVWTHPVRAPDFAIACPDGKAGSLGALRGRIVRLGFGAAPPARTAATDPAIVDVAVPEPGRTAEGCIAADPRVRAAYAIVAGRAPERLAGAEFVIDRDGWLRSLRQGAGSDEDQAAQVAEIIEICRDPVHPSEGIHVHHAN
jgi:mono/diheme cytochrome c family protein